MKFRWRFAREQVQKAWKLSISSDLPQRVIPSEARDLTQDHGTFEDPWVPPTLRERFFAPLRMTTLFITGSIYPCA
jgi:hypothetical protein